MERLYNPDLMPEAEIKATFVARQSLLDELISLIARQPDGAGVQHVVLIAPRGMGKTTVLLMVRFAIKDRSLATQWQTVKFPEESYGVNDLADLWLETLKHLAAETNDLALNERVESLKAQYPDNEDLQEAALALIKDWRRKHGKRLALLVDNFDLILEQINDERDNAHLREVLMNDGTMMLIGGATTFFHEARAYEQPLYNFFRIYNLDELKFPEIQELLRQRAEVDDIPNFEQTLNANPGRLRVLTYFTGGNPRLVLMLYHVVTQADVIQVRSGLEKLLDEVTPYYKAKTESLPPQQRKILDHIARVSSMTHEGVTPTEIAAATRLLANQVSAQLKRLSELGYVRAANLRGRSSYYALSEPLYAIWYQMRFGRTARQRMQWLVEFLQVWYENVDISAESRQLDARFREYQSTGYSHEARKVLEYRRYLVEAMKDSPLRTYEMEGVIRGYLEFKETDFLKKEVLPTIQLENLSPETLQALVEAGCISEQQVSHAQGSTPASLEAQQKAEVGAKIVLSLRAAKESFESRRLDEALQQLDHVLRIKPDMPEAWFLRSIILVELSRYEDAIASYDRGLEVKPDSDEAWYNRSLACLGKCLSSLGRGDVDLARLGWLEALSTAERMEREKWHQIASEALLAMAEVGYPELARQLLTESHLEEPLFPLARALDYVLTGEEALLEKLSPEMRKIVDEVVKKLQATSGQVKQKQTKPRTRKSQTGPRRRVAKQLR